MTLISCSTRINHFSHYFSKRLCVQICVHDVCNDVYVYSVRMQFAIVPLVICHLAYSSLWFKHFWWNANFQNNLKFCFIVSTILSPLIIEINWKTDENLRQNREREREMEKEIQCSKFIVDFFLIRFCIGLAQEFISQNEQR